MGLWDGDVGLGMGGDGDGRMGTKGWGLGDRQLVRGDGGKGDSGRAAQRWGHRLGLPGHRAPPGGDHVTSSRWWMQTRLSIW